MTRGASKAKDRAARKLPFREASDVARVRGTAFAIVVSDEEEDALFVVDPKRPRKAYKLRYPRDIAVADAEALAPGETSARAGFYVVASQGLTQDGGKRKDSRDVIARVVLSRDGRSIRSARLSRPIRKRLLKHLQRTLDRRRFDLEALAVAVPDRGGLNIEGAVLHRGRLLLGLRSPCASDGAIVLVPIVEPKRLFKKRARKPTFEEPIVVSARQGEGIRSLTPDGNDLLLLLGPSRATDDIPFRIARWRADEQKLEAVSTKPLPRRGKLEGVSQWDAGSLLLVTDRRSRKPAKVLHFVDLE